MLSYTLMEKHLFELFVKIKRFKDISYVMLEAIATLKYVIVYFIIYVCVLVIQRVWVSSFINNSLVEFTYKWQKNGVPTRDPRCLYVDIFCVCVLRPFNSKVV